MCCVCAHCAAYNPRGTGTTGDATQNPSSQEYYRDGEYIVREGEKGETFFLLNSGSVTITQLVEGSDEPKEIRRLHQGDFFGEKALLGEEVEHSSQLRARP